MKKAFAIFFLITFIIQSTTSLWIITSFYLQQDYISENLCINRFDAVSVCKGQCYLANQIEEDQNKEQSIPLIKLQDVQPLIQQNHTSILPEPAYFDLFILSPLTDRVISSDFIFSVFHPPRS